MPVAITKMTEQQYTGNNRAKRIAASSRLCVELRDGACHCRTINRIVNCIKQHYSYDIAKAVTKLPQGNMGLWHVSPFWPPAAVYERGGARTAVGGKKESITIQFDKYCVDGTRIIVPVPQRESGYSPVYRHRGDQKHNQAAEQHSLPPSSLAFISPHVI